MYPTKGNAVSDTASRTGSGTPVVSASIQPQRCRSPNEVERELLGIAKEPKAQDKQCPKNTQQSRSQKSQSSSWVASAVPMT